MARIIQKKTQIKSMVVVRLSHGSGSNGSLRFLIIFCRIWIKIKGLWLIWFCFVSEFGEDEKVIGLHLANIPLVER
jgi:hypothetical protein